MSKKRVKVKKVKKLKYEILDNGFTVVIDGNQYIVASTVVELLSQLEKEGKAKAKKEGKK